MSKPIAASNPLHLYLVRHGETPWVLTQQHTGITEVPLTTDGAHEAQELGRHLKKVRFAQVFSSPRQRCRQTCALAGLGQAAVIDADLAELNYGDYEGQRSEEIRLARPDWEIFLDGCPNGESTKELSDRADRVIARLKLLSGNIALFTHGQFGCALTARWIGLAVESAMHFTLDTASFSVLSFDHHHPDIPVVENWNAMGHELPVADTPEVAMAGGKAYWDKSTPKWDSNEPPEDLRLF